MSLLTKIKSIELSQENILALFETKYGYIVYRLLNGNVDITEFLLDLTLANIIFDKKLNIMLAGEGESNVQLN